MTKRVALITGGSMGLGKAVAEHFEKLNYDVVTCARSGDVTYACDVGARADVEQMMTEIAFTYKRLDVLVNNAAVYGPVGQIDDVAWTEWWHAIRINLLGPMLCATAALSLMRVQGKGKIINVSGAGVRPQPECTAYNASKAGLLRFTEALAVDLAGTGIDVNSVAPGTLDTRMRLRSPMPENPDLAMAQAVAMIAWLASDESDGITGRFFSAVWDSIGNLDDLGPDDYRMRRIAP